MSLIIYTILVVLVNVSQFGLNEKLFNVWYKNNEEKFWQIDEEHDSSIEDILYSYLGSMTDDDIPRILTSDYEAQLSNILTSTLNIHGHGYKNLIYDSILDKILNSSPYPPFKTTVSQWVQQNYATYGNQTLPIKVLLLEA